MRVEMTLKWIITMIGERIVMVSSCSASMTSAGS